MAVINPPSALPGLGRAIVNFLMENRSTWNEAGLVNAFKPEGLNKSAATHDVTNTLSAFRAIGIVENDTQGNITVAEDVAKHGNRFERDEFRRLILDRVLDLGRDGDPWTIGEGEAATSGARDLTRALSWFLAQDALGAPLRWTDSAQNLQFTQIGPKETGKWPIVSDAQWGSFARWTLALGLGVPSVVRAKPGIVPLPAVAISDVVAELPDTRMSIQEFLAVLASKLPVLHGGTVRSSLVTRLGHDPDPGVQGKVVDTSISQALRILEVREVLKFESLADAEGVFLSRSARNRTTHVTLKDRKKR